MGVKSANRIQQKPYYFASKLRTIEQSGREVINLAIGNPDLPPHPRVVAALREAVVQPKVHGYPSYRGMASLRVAMADWYARYMGVTLDPELEVMPLMGSKEGIVHLTLSYANPGDKILCPDPGYPVYAAAAELAEAEVVTYTLDAQNQWSIDLDELSAMDLSRVKILWVNYPHMPTGARTDPGYFKDLVAFSAAHDILLVNDNPYAFILNDRPTSILSYRQGSAPILELNSLSKCLNMAGWRVGMLLGDPELLHPVWISKSKTDSGMFLPVQMAAEEALRLDAGWYDQLNQTYTKRRRVAWELLDAWGCTYDREAVGLFVWAAVPQSWASGEALSDAALEAGVFVAPGSVFGSAGARYLRLSLCQNEDIFREAMRRTTHLKPIKQEVS